MYMTRTLPPFYGSWSESVAMVSGLPLLSLSDGTEHIYASASVESLSHMGTRGQPESQAGTSHSNEAVYSYAEVSEVEAINRSANVEETKYITPVSVHSE